MERRVAYTLTLFVFAGCGDGLAVAPVAGTITFGSKPLANATITTQPIAAGSRNPGPGSFGRTDEQGHFELELVTPPRTGAIVGEHRVMISPAEGAAASRQPHRSADGTQIFWTDDPQGHKKGPAEANWPQEFVDGSLMMTVTPEGTNQQRFDLKQ